MGIYTAGLINNLWHPPFFVSIVAGGLLAALMGYVIGALALRMRDIYLALSTFAFGEAMQWVFLNWDAVTNGSNGFRISPATLFGYELVSDIKAYPFVVLIAALLLWTTVLLSRSQLGSAFRAVRESDVAAQAMGVNVNAVKRAAFTLSAAYAGIAGGMYTLFASFIHPESLGFQTTILILTHGGGGRHRLGARRHRRRADLRPDLGTAAPGAVVPGNHLWRDSHGLHDVRSQGAVRRPPGRAPRGGVRRGCRQDQARECRMSQHPHLEVQGLTVKFGGLTAINGLSMQVERGRIHARSARTAPASPPPSTASRATTVPPAAASASTAPTSRAEAA